MSLIEIEKKHDYLPDSPFKTRNHLDKHPLFETNRVKELLRSLPRNCVEIRLSQSTSTHDGNYRRGIVLEDEDPVEAFEKLQERPRWILLKSVWLNDKEYAQMIKEYIQELSSHFDDMKDLSDFGCWIFLSSPHSVVHFHMDTDYGFVNEIRGSKKVFIYRPETLDEYEREKVAYTHQQDQVYKPEYEKFLFPSVDLNGGETAFLPLYAPHRVVNGDSVCIAINIGFHTKKSRRQKKVHMVNFDLRSLGLEPTPFNRYPILDSVKARSFIFFRLKNKLLKALRPKIAMNKDVSYR